MTTWETSAELGPEARGVQRGGSGAETLLNLQMEMIRSSLSKRERGQNDSWSFCLSQQM